ncbi:MAG: DEAD/DEAH box helicase [bacterium]|nr:DEAD/DEAH box helicase [bacterium]
MEVDLTGLDIIHTCTCNSAGLCCSHVSAALVHLSDMFEEDTERDAFEGEKYTRDEMIRRVIKERKERAGKEDFSVELSDNAYGFHRIKTSAGKTYDITIRDFNSGSGYCSCPDFKTNKLATCKHLIVANSRVKQAFPINKIVKNQPYPFLEIFCDPLNDYHITYYYKGKLEHRLDSLLKNYFVNGDYILPNRYLLFIPFLKEASNFKKILVRPEVEEKVAEHFDRLELEKLKRNVRPDFSGIKATLFPYQEKGVLFSLFKKGNIIADEMGLGKTIQAISTAMLKRDIFGFRRVLVVCPASLKYQWKKEIERFTGQEAVVVEGLRSKRQALYRDASTYFLVANYEAVMRDITVIKKYPPDMIILDEAQRIKNYDTKTSHAVKAIPKKHSLVITGTPIENRLIDLYSIMNFIDPDYLAPLWEFSMNHCLFDKSKKNKINGYYNLQALKKRLETKIIRREKSDVMEELPEVQEMTVPITLSDHQMEIHMGYARRLAPLLAKKFKTVYDMQRIFQILTSMRMVCNSTYLVDKESHESPKLEELKEILLEKLNIKKSTRKIIIFSEWITMLNLIEKVLQAENIGYAMLTGKVPVKERGKLIDRFSGNSGCKVFLSTEAGGTGLNLQAADTVINFELPWNPARKNQRIGRIHRIGQKSSSLTLINLVAVDSIEERIAAGIELKESVFDAVLNEGNLTDEVDFTKKGRSTMIQQIEKIVSPFITEQVEIPGTEILEKEIAGEEIFDLPGVPDDMDLQSFASEDDSLLQEDSGDPAAPDEVLCESPPGEELPVPAGNKSQPEPRIPQPEEIENTLNQGLQFLNGILNMATGKQMTTGEQSIRVDRDTGEVVMKFKLPRF